MEVVTLTTTVVDDAVVVKLVVGGAGAAEEAAAEDTPKAPPSADREAEGARVRERIASQEYAKREDVQEMMQALMQATISARPSDPLPYMIRFLEKQVQRRELGWGQ